MYSSSAANTFLAPSDLPMTEAGGSLLSVECSGRCLFLAASMGTGFPIPDRVAEAYP
jgi:hypothetical protein